MDEEVLKELTRLHYLKEKCTAKWQLELIYHRMEELHRLLEDNRSVD